MWFAGRDENAVVHVDIIVLVGKLRPGTDENGNGRILRHRLDAQLPPRVDHLVHPRLGRPDNVSRTWIPVPGRVDADLQMRVGRLRRNVGGIVFNRRPHLRPHGKTVILAGDHVRHLLVDARVKGGVQLEPLLGARAAMHPVSVLVGLSVFILRPEIGRIVVRVLPEPRRPLVTNVQFADAVPVIKALFKTGIPQQIA